MPKKLDSVQPFHFFASTFAGWGTALNREDAIKVALVHSGSTLAGKGMDVYSVRVGLPHSATYRISNYAPADVPISEREQSRYALKGSKVVALAGN